MKKIYTMKKMHSIGALAIVRCDDFDRLCEIVDGCIAGGIPVLEMSYTLNSAGDMIKKVKEKYKDEICIGAGTVLDRETARHAILSGAEFIIAPNFNKEVNKMCNLYGIPYAPGCTSLTEVTSALSYGSSFIKAFPISNFYGSNLVKVFKTPIPQMSILASGGITLENIDQWLESGVDICGFGSLLTNGTSEQIATNAKQIKMHIDQYRN